MKKLVLVAIRIYQQFLNLNNPIMRTFFGVNGACRFSPTCSDYMYAAVQKHGIITGLTLGSNRIFRCHPWTPGGFDPVP